MTTEQKATELYRMAYQCCAQRAAGCNGSNCINCQFNVSLYVSDAREAMIIKTSAEIDYAKVAAFQQRHATSNIVQSIGGFLMIGLIVWGIASCRSCLSVKKKPVVVQQQQQQTQEQKDQYISEVTGLSKAQLNEVDAWFISQQSEEEKRAIAAHNADPNRRAADGSTWKADIDFMRARAKQQNASASVAKPAPASMSPTQEITWFLRNVVAPNMRDVNNDGAIDCVDYSVVFYENWTATPVYMYTWKEPNSYHMFVALEVDNIYKYFNKSFSGTRILVEPQALTDSWGLNECWPETWYDGISFEDETARFKIYARLK